MDQISSEDSRARRIIDHLLRNVLADPDLECTEDTPLVSSGLVDSFALVDLLTILEQVTGYRIPSGRISPMDLDTVAKMLQTADRLGQGR